MIRKKELLAAICDLNHDIVSLAATNSELANRLDKLEERQEIDSNVLSGLNKYCHDKLCTNHKCVEERKAVKIKVKAKPGRPKKVCVKKK